MTQQRVKVQYFVPEFGSVQDDYNFFDQFLGLHQREDLAELVESAVAAGKHHQRFRKISEPELAHEEVVEFEGQLRRDEGIGALLERQTDIESDGLPAGVLRAAIGCFHDAGPAAAPHHKSTAFARTIVCPFRYPPRHAPLVL